MLAKPGGYISHEFAGSDAVGSLPVPGGHKLVQARKCKACSEILSESNYEKSEAERAQEMREQAVKSERVRAFVKKGADSLASAFMVLFFIALGGMGGGLIVVAALKLASGEYLLAAVGALAGIVLTGFCLRLVILWWSELPAEERASIRASIFSAVDQMLLYLIGVGLLLLLTWLFV